MVSNTSCSNRKEAFDRLYFYVGPRTESGWTRKYTDGSEQVRANTDDRAGSGTPSKCRKISTPETLPVGVATKIARKYRRMHHTRSPLSTTARRLLLNKLHVGESRSVDLSSHFQCILELVRARVSRALAKRRAQELKKKKKKS